MSLKQILTSAFLLTSSLLVKAQYGGGGGNGYGNGSGGGNQGNQATGYNGGGGGNQGNQATSYNGGRNGEGGGYSNGWTQGMGIGSTATALAQTVSIMMTETMLATTTVTESCTTAGNALASSTMGAAPPGASTSGTVLVQVVHVSDNNGSLKYFPESVVAAPGTLVEFVFYPKVCSSLS